MRGHRHNADSVRIASSLCPDMIFRKDSISTTLAIAAVVVTSTVSSASAQSFSSSWGTGNVLPSYYDSRGRLVTGSPSEDKAIAVDRRGLSAFAAAPASGHATIAIHRRTRSHPRL